MPTAKKPAAKTPDLDVDKAAAFLELEPDELRRSWARGLEPGTLAKRDKAGDLVWSQAALRKYKTAQDARSVDPDDVTDAGSP